MPHQREHLFVVAVHGHPVLVHIGYGELVACIEPRQQAANILTGQRRAAQHVPSTVETASAVAGDVAVERESAHYGDLRRHAARGDEGPYAAGTRRSDGFGGRAGHAVGGEAHQRTVYVEKKSFDFHDIFV